MAGKSTPKGFAESKARYRASRSGGVGVGADDAIGGKRNLPPPERLPDGTIRYFLVLGPKGRVLVPADMRAALDLGEGDVITAWLKDGEVRMHSHLHGLRKIQSGAASKAKGSGYASDELIAERRAEALKEEKEALRERREQKSKRRRSS